MEREVCDFPLSVSLLAEKERIFVRLCPVTRNGHKSADEISSFNVFFVNHRFSGFTAVHKRSAKEFYRHNSYNLTAKDENIV